MATIFWSHFFEFLMIEKLWTWKSNLLYLSVKKNYLPNLRPFSKSLNKHEKSLPNFTQLVNLFLRWGKFCSVSPTILKIFPIQKFWSNNMKFVVSCFQTRSINCKKWLCIGIDLQVINKQKCPLSDCAYDWKRRHKVLH